MKLSLFYAPHSCALVPFVTLTEAGAAFETVPLNFRKGQHKRPDYLAINPQHKVPALVVDGMPLMQNVAIQIWIARNFPDAGLLPSDPLREIEAIALMSWCGSDIHPHLSRWNGPAKYCALPEAAESIRAIAAQLLFENFAIAEDRLAGRDYFFDAFTAVDAYFFWCFRRATEYALDLSGFPNCLAHFARMQSRASVQKVLAYEKQVESEFA